MLKTHAILVFLGETEEGWRDGMSFDDKREYIHGELRSAFPGLAIAVMPPEVHLQFVDAQGRSVEDEDIGEFLRGNKPTTEDDTDDEDEEDEEDDEDGGASYAR
jgi:hypothetical protein